MSDNLYLPQNETEAEWMQKVGYRWVEENAPHKLTQMARDNSMADIADKLAEALVLVLKSHDLTCQGENCQMSGIDLGKRALADYRKAKGE